MQCALLGRGGCRVRPWNSQRSHGGLGFIRGCLTAIGASGSGEKSSLLENPNFRLVFRTGHLKRRVRFKSSNKLLDFWSLVVRFLLQCGL